MILTWCKNCVLADMTVDATADPAIVASSGAICKITDTKLYAPSVTLSKRNEMKILEQLKLGFKRTIKWNIYRSEMIIQPQNNNLDYLIDPNLQMSIDYLF